MSPPDRNDQPPGSCGGPPGGEARKRGRIRAVARFASAVREERRARGDHRAAPAALSVISGLKDPPGWMRVPGRTLHPRVSRIGGEPAPVTLDPLSAPVLEHALEGTLVKGRRSAHFEVCLSVEGERVIVLIGSARVGTLEPEVSERLRPLIAQGVDRKQRLLAVAALTPQRDRSLLLSVFVPPREDRG